MGKRPDSHGRVDTECWCPACGNPHIKNINWVGNGVPRKLCPACRNNVELGSFYDGSGHSVHKRTSNAD